MTEKRLRELTEKLQNAPETSEKLESLRELLEDGRLYKTDGDPLKKEKTGKNKKDEDENDLTDKELEKLLADEGLLLDDGDEKLLMIKEAPGPNGVPEMQTERMSIDDLVKMLLPGAAKDSEAAAKMRRKLRDLLWNKKKKEALPDPLAALLLARMAARMRQKMKRPFKKPEEVLQWERETVAEALKKADNKNPAEAKKHRDPEKYLKEEAVQKCLDARMRELAGEEKAKENVPERENKSASDWLVETIRQVDERAAQREKIWADGSEERPERSDKMAFWEKIAAMETERIMARLEGILDQPKDQPFLERVEDLIEGAGARDVRELVSNMTPNTLHALSDKVSSDPGFDLEGVLENVARGGISPADVIEEPVREAAPQPEPETKKEPEPEKEPAPEKQGPALFLGLNE